LNYFDSRKKNSTVTMQVACAIVFCLFSFCWLYWFQTDVLAVAQHVLSGGVTHYNRTVGALLITFVLMLLQQVVTALVRLYHRSHAITYLPSMLFLAVISDVNPDMERGCVLGGWWIAVPLVILLWGGGVWVARQSLPILSEKMYSNVFSRGTWMNLFQLTVMMLLVVATANSNAVFHYRAHAETALLTHDTDEALRVGWESHETDVHLTMLRAYALSQQGLMGERLFEYPIVGTGNDLLPLPSSRSRLLLLSADTLFLHLGAKPRGKMTASRYYDLLERDTLATRAVADYRLCGLLVDRRIDDFAAQLPKYYAINDSLPRHYREALVLYAHQRSHPTLIYHHAVMDEDWDDFHKLSSAYSDKRERKGKVYDHYATSYWYYYFYE
jgi:hypothetical protein